MSVDPASLALTPATLPAALAGSAPLLRFQGADALERSLSLGQVIEGRVMRSFQGGRYLMELQGQEKVVDSAIPLQEGQALRGRVLALGEQVVLEKMIDAPARKALPDQEAAAPAWLTRMDDAQAMTLFRQHARALEPGQWRALEALAASQGAERAVLCALTLHAVGMPQHAAALHALASALRGMPLSSPDQAGLEAGLLAGAAAPSLAGMTDAAAALLSHAAEHDHDAMAQGLASGGPPDADGGRGDGGQATEAWWRQLARRLLNGQPAGALAHRMLSLPLCIDGRLVEFSVALFDESGQAELQPALKQRALRLALDLDGLGKIDLTARVVDRHLSIDVLAASPRIAERLGSFDRQLGAALAGLGWIVDGARYGVAAPDGDNPVVRSVMERMVAGDSFRIVA